MTQRKPVRTHLGNRAVVALGAAMVALVGSGLAMHANAQTAIDDINKYREMIADGNPAELYEASGEELWKKPMGPKNASLEKCDLGLGAGVVKGAYAQLPRYFADTKRVQDLESRLLTCQQTLQGLDPQEAIKTPFGKGRKNDLVALATYISGESKGMPVKAKAVHPQEKAMLAMGQRLFYYQGGPHDFSCATCHGEAGKRIRLQELPQISTPAGAAAGWTSWPAYRVSSGQMWSMQWRLNDCFRQQRFPEPIYTSDVTIALSMFMAHQSGQSKVNMATPGLKR